MSDGPSDATARNHGVRRGGNGILSRSDEYLMIRRADGVANPGGGFPGGHVEPDETPR